MAAKVKGLTLEIDGNTVGLEKGLAKLNKPMRAGTDLQRGHFIPLYRSYRLISYNGYFKGTKSRAAAEALNQQKLFKSAKWAVRAAAIKERSLAV